MSLRRFTPALVCAALFSVTACTNAPAPSPSPPPSSAASKVDPAAPITTNARPAGPSLLPGEMTDEGSDRVGSLIYRSLFAPDAKGKLEPAVATSMTSRNGRTWTIEINPAATFSDGTPITAQTLADSWAFTAHRLAEKGIGSPLRSIEGYPGDGRALKGVRVENTHTLTITLSSPIPTYDALAGDLAFVPIPDAQRADPTTAATRPIGNGPYVLATPWTGTGTYTLRPSGVYNGPDQPRNPGITFTTYPSVDEAYAALGRSELDLIDEIPPTVTDADARGFTVSSQPVGVVQSLDFPTNNPTWTGALGRARKGAISRAIDRPGVAQTYNGARTPATGLSAPVVEGWSPDTCGELCTLDQRAAARLWAPVAVPSVSVAYAADGTDATAVSQICTDLTSALSVTCTPRAYTSESDLAQAVRSGEVAGPYIRTWRMAQRTLGGFLVPRYSPGAAQNWPHWTDTLAQVSLSLAASAPAENSTPAFAAAERLVLAALPSVPLWSVSATTTSSESVTDVVTDSEGRPVYGRIVRAP